MVCTVNYGTSIIRFSVSRSDRKTLAIEVHPDLSVQVIAPPAASISDIKEKVLKRARWIRRQQLYFEQFLPRTPKREYVSGESHYYLGRRYVLRVRKSSESSVKLKGGEMVVKTKDPGNTDCVRLMLTDWYYKHAEDRFRLAVEEGLKYFRNYKIAQPGLIIRRMRGRWGSCTPNGKILLNPEIIKAPSKCIDYVVIHELCHMVHYNHSAGFYRLQSRVMPDWEKWKLRLERVLA